MADGPPPEFCQQTRESFGDLIKKPPLTDKLLSRPPFRFIHDVTSEVIKQSGFLKGLFSPDELDAKKVADKEAKIAFLSKTLDSIQFAIGQKLDVNPGKVVAGKEPEKTNLFLQKLALAAKSTSPDANVEVVKRVLAGEKPTEDNLTLSGGSAGSNKENRDQKKSDKSSSGEKRAKEKGEKVEKEKKTKEKENEKNGEKKAKRSSSKEKEKKKPVKEEKSEEKKKKKTSTSPTKKKKAEKGEKKLSDSVDHEPSEPQIALTNGHAEGMGADDAQAPDLLNVDDTQHSPTRAISHSATVGPRKAENQGLEAQPRMAKSARPVTAGSGGARPGTAMIRPGTSMGRPGSSAGRAPPRLKRRELGEVENPAARIDSATSQQETTNLIISQEPSAATNNVAEDEDNFIVEEQVPSIGETLLAESDVRDGHADADELDADDHGALVGRILQTKKKLEAGLEDESVPDRPMVVFDEREREKIQKETGKIQESVQQLTRNAHPLGRLVDYLQEDVDSMLKELESWRAEYKKNLAKLRQTQGSERTDLEPFRQKLNELEDQIREERDAIAASRGQILHNESRLQGLIGSVAK